MNCDLRKTVRYSSLFLSKRVVLGEKNVSALKTHPTSSLLYFHSNYLVNGTFHYEEVILPLTKSQSHVFIPCENG